MSKEAKFYFTSDIHGHIFPNNWKDRSFTPYGLMCLQEFFEKDENTLLIDGGDSLQGSPLTYLCHEDNRPEFIAEIMNELGYDYITLGNHDFNYGTEYLNRYLSSSKAVPVCQNYLSSNDERCLAPWRVHTLGNGLRVGLIGAVTDSVNIWEREENLSGCKIVDVVSAISEVYEEFMKSCDISVCIYHGGYECDLDNFNRLENGRENVGVEICEKFDFDLLLCCHQHMLTEGRNIHGTYTMQNASQAATAFEIRVRVEDDKKIISSKLLKSSEADIPTLSDEHLKFFDRLQIWLDRTIGKLDQPLYPSDRIDMALNGSALADFINHIQKDYLGTDLSCTSFANEIPGLPVKVRIRDLLLTYPFPNTLVAIEIDGKTLKKGLERAAEYLSIDNDSAGKYRISEHFLKPKVEHYNYDFFLGVTADIDYSKEFGTRVGKMWRCKDPYENNQSHEDEKIADLSTENNLEIKDDDIFTLAMNNYRASGAGNYPFYTTCKVIRRDARDVFDVLCDYFLK